MKTYEILNELFDKPYPFELNLNSLGGTFKDSTGMPIGVYYEKLNPKFDIHGLAFMSGPDYSTELTNNRDSIKVLSTVMAIADACIRRAKPRAVLFTSKKSDIGRSELYSRMVKKLVSRYGFTDISSKLGEVLQGSEFGDALRKEARWHSTGKTHDSFVLIKEEELS